MLSQRDFSKLQIKFLYAFKRQVRSRTLNSTVSEFFSSQTDMLPEKAYNAACFQDEYREDVNILPHIKAEHTQRELETHKVANPCNKPSVADVTLKYFSNPDRLLFNSEMFPPQIQRVQTIFWRKILVE